MQCIFVLFILFNYHFFQISTVPTRSVQDAPLNPCAAGGRKPSDCPSERNNCIHKKHILQKQNFVKAAY